MHATLLRRSLIPVAVALAIGAGSVVGATTPPDESAAVPDPEVAAAVAVFDQRMVAAGHADLGPAADVMVGEGGYDPEWYEGCSPEMASALTTMNDLAGILAPGTAQSHEYGPATDPGAVTTTTDLFDLFGNQQAVSAMAVRLAPKDVQRVDDMVGLMGTPEFATCFEQVMVRASVGDLGLDEMTDFTMPEMPSLTLPEMPVLTMPDLSIPGMPDFTMPEMPDFTMPELPVDPQVVITSTGDVGVGERSARFGFEISVDLLGAFEVWTDTVLVRQGDVLITVSNSRTSVTGDPTGAAPEPMDVDIVAEAAAIVEAL
ncbi:MAG: hypothetical protein ACK5OX_09610 [Desertimonas sp.]